MQAESEALNSKMFLDSFADIEAWLRKLAQSDRSTPFYYLVERATKTNRDVRRYGDELKEFADLRNAIIHERTDGHVIAEPNRRAVDDIMRIRSALLKPPVLIPRFQRLVRVREIQDSIASAVSDMRRDAFSQLPILKEGKIAAVLTSDTVVRWLASEVANDLVSLMDTKVEAVIPYTEDPENYSLLSAQSTLQEAVSCFEDFAVKGKKLDAVLITPNARPIGPLLGILTIFDLPEILGNLGLRRL